MHTKDWAAAESEALTLDARDALAPLRDEFLIPRHSDGSEQAYFCGNLARPAAARGAPGAAR